ncbi:tripartite tricarboxylate transporter substrate-binding protein [Bordetella hinzii]|uniref:tripartite tricarboxylate transporter substrate-binding protein n=1 Tax=Bordetella hinzii TaxID=103855 RepID=UPI0004595B78|nr:tripartite tricarboxylate transporter substrate-binding protein [Bordetella hinzii]KCB50609.1 tripartite tricarboxylate transporter family receptor [Bordetella hinzii 1277]QDJ50529.1 ABC transporter substrate-binding protein [Bordetella hinzii]QWF36975.1 tripartite tricarboxylate transporter substrate binding protein [Bordetella hinzii]QWF41519.1 tripartite tricarboxylate transporter substrate binding protein [Bordetella hinzii]QWF46060.1 tripartite tricarboxylate transporter substrate bind
MKNILQALALCALATGVQAQQAPTPVPKQLKIVVPFSAGASNDAIARALAPQLAEQLKTIVIVENRVGAAGVIGSDYVAKSAKDGATLLLTSSTFLTSAATQPRMPYDPVKSFAPVAMVGEGPLVIGVTGAKPYASLADVLEAARAKPDVLNYGTAGIGSLAHLATVMMNDAAHVSMTHVPYKGAANAASDMAGGQIDIMLANYSSLAPLVQSGKIKLVATTARDPHPAFPKLAPAAAILPGYAVDIWVGVFAPAGTPQDLIDRYNQAINRVARTPESTALLDMDGTVPAAIGSTEFAQRVARDYALWRDVAQSHHISVE